MGCHLPVVVSSYLHLLIEISKNGAAIFLSAPHSDSTTIPLSSLIHLQCIELQRWCEYASSAKIHLAVEPTSQNHWANGRAIKLSEKFYEISQRFFIVDALKAIDEIGTTCDKNCLIIYCPLFWPPLASRRSTLGAHVAMCSHVHTHTYARSQIRRSNPFSVINQSAH